MTISPRTLSLLSGGVFLVGGLWYFARAAGLIRWRARSAPSTHRWAALLQGLGMMGIGAGSLWHDLLFAWPALLIASFALLVCGGALDVRATGCWQAERRRAIARDPEVVRPRITPEDATDLLITGAAGVLIFAMLLGPAALLWWMTGHWILAAVFLAGAAFLGYRNVVGLLRINAEGMHFSRHSAIPEVLRWKDITEIRPASRGEVVVLGWLWLPVPAREASPSLSSLGHYRITSRTGFCFYPPEDEQRFLALLQQPAPKGVVHYAGRLGLHVPTAARHPA